MLPVGATNTLPAGISISVSYTPKLPPVAHRDTDPDVNLGAFQGLPMSKKIVVNKRNVAGHTLLASETLTLLKIDLRNYFKMDRAGSYRVSTSFHIPGKPTTQTGDFSFSLDHPDTP